MHDWNITDKSEGLENAGQENDGQKCMAGKYRTRKRRKSKVQRFRSFSVIFSLHDMTRCRRNKEQVLYMTLFTRTACCTIMILFTQTASCRTGIGHGFKVHRIVAKTTLSVYALH